ncbi:insulinase family protein [Hellea sp.]|nr:insulinase family protein [Hellea sp.]
MTFKDFLLTGAAAILLGACGGGVTSSDNASDTTAPAAKQSQASFSLPYEKFTLDNGLDVILHVDRSDPIVAFTTVVHAGSNREKPGRTGFAHFFEHMAFNDSENVPRGWNRKAIPDWGGQRNGGTWSDGTIYYEVVPKDAFDKILWIDSDRLGYMINTVTTAALEREKQVVKNEKRQRVDNAAYGYTQEVIRKALYPEGHPYNWTVIGSLPDLQAATLDDLKEFYAANYGPNNATLVIAGDIDVAETKEKVKLWFGEIPKGQDIEPLKPMPVVLEETKSLYFEDNFAKLPEIRLTFPSVQALHEDEVALDVLGQILAGGKNSVLYTEIVSDQKLAPNVSAFNNSSEIAGEFVIRVRAKSGTDLDDVKAAIEAAMTRFEEEGVNPDDLTRIKAEQETGLYAGLSTILGKANQMARDNEFAGDPAHVVKTAKAINDVTAEDVMAAYNSYIKDKPSIITSFVPKGQKDLAVDGAELATVWIEDVTSGKSNEEVSQGEEAVYEKTVTKHDRSEPPFGELPLFKMPDVWDQTLSNDVRLVGIENSETPLVSFDITISGGTWNDPKGKTGRAGLLAGMMNEGTASKTAAELEQAIGLLGSDITVFATREETVIRVTTLAKNFGPTVSLVEEILSSPRWDDAGLEKVKSSAITAIKGREANPNFIGSGAFNRLLYGKNHPLGRAGTVETVSSHTLDDLKAAHEQLLASKPQIHLVGDVSEAEAAKALDAIASTFNPDGQDRETAAITPQNETAKVFFIDVPGSKQSVLNIGRLTVPTPNPDFDKLDFTNEKLGGSIAGDLSQTLRIEKGYTYGAFSGISSGLVPQPFRIRTSVRANATGASLDVIKDMVGSYADNFDEAARETTQQKIIKDNTRAYESSRAKLALLQNITKYRKSKRYVEDAQATLVDMQVADFKNIAEEYLDESDMIYVVVGDKATQFEPVQDFAKKHNKGEVVELDIYGAPL